MFSLIPRQGGAFLWSTALPSSRTLLTSTRCSAPANISRLTVVGSGTMGIGISHVALMKGVKVVLLDHNPVALDKALVNIRKALPEQAEGLSTTTDMAEAVKDAELVIEAVPERMAFKQDVFRAADKAARPECLFATNTSSLLVKDISSVCSLERQKLFGGLHFFAPVQITELVEVARTDLMTEDAFETLLAFGRKMRTTALPCTDVPGFVINRLVIPIMLEAFKIIERGQTTPKELDEALQAMSWPPVLHFADAVGIDIYANIIEGAAEKAGTEMIPREWGEAVPMLDEMMTRGELGVKTGKGFFEYPENK